METKIERKHCLHRNQIIGPLPNVRNGQLDRHFENEISFSTEGSHNNHKAIYVIAAYEINHK